MLKNGVPSESTLCRVEHGIDVLALADRMQEFAELFRRRLYKAEGDKEIICVDGKAERGTVLDNGRSPDIVSAYSYNTGITLATEACRRTPRCWARWSATTVLHMERTPEKEEGQEKGDG